MTNSAKSVALHWWGPHPTMKTKPVTIQIPVKYKWRAVQPWGEVTFFIRKPVIVKDTLIEGDEYWGAQDDEFSIEYEGQPRPKDWKKTRQRI